MTDFQNPTSIWLQPWCDKRDKEAWGASDGRQWCEDDVWVGGDICECKPVRYIIDKRQSRADGETP